MIRNISAPIPLNPSPDDFSDYLQRNGISVVREAVMEKYTGLDSRHLEFTDAESINHSLTLKAFGREYADFDDTLGSSVDDYDGFPDSVRSLDALFLSQGLRFPSGTVLWKGISHGKSYYRFLDIPGLVVGDTFCFPGYISCSARKDVARRFVGGVGGVLLNIRNIQYALALVPENATIINGKAGGDPEYEVLLQRGLIMRVVESLANHGNGPEMTVEVCESSVSVKGL